MNSFAVPIITGEPEDSILKTTFSSPSNNTPFVLLMVILVSEFPLNIVNEIAPAVAAGTVVIVHELPVHPCSGCGPR